MLHINQKVRFRLFTVLWLCIAFFSCKRDASDQSEAEAVYMADYESPDHLWGFMDTTGQLMIEALYDDVMAFSEGLACVNKAGRWGYVDQSGQEIIPFSYRSGWAFQEGFARVKPFDGHTHFISRSGKTLISDAWEATDDFSEGMARVSLGHIFGYIDTSGNMAIPGPFAKAGQFKHGLAIVTPEEKVGVIQKDGQFLLEPQFTSVRWTSEKDFLICQKEDTSYLYELNGDLKFSMTEGIIRDANTHMASIDKNQEFYLVDIQSVAFTPTLAWKALIYINENRWAGSTDHGYFMLSTSGQKLNLKPYTQINKISQGYAACFDGQYWGYLDTAGKETTQDIFGLAWDYKEGFARVAFKDGIAFINRQQQLAFYPPPGTIDMRDFSEGLAPVQIMQ